MLIFDMPLLNMLVSKILEPFSEKRKKSSDGEKAVDNLIVLSKATFLDNREKQEWMESLYSSCNAVEKHSMQHLLLEKIELQELDIEQLQKAFKNMQAPFIYKNISATSSIINMRLHFEQVIRDAILQTKWDVSQWSNREHWIDIIASKAWTTNFEKSPDYIEYLYKMGTKYEWARDYLLAYRVLNMLSSEKMGIVLSGQASESIHFTTALSASSLRTLKKNSTHEEKHLHQVLQQAWPQAMAHIEAIMHAFSIIESIPLQEFARISEYMETSVSPYSAYLAMFGQDIWELQMQHKVTHQVAIPLEGLLDS